MHRYQKVLSQQSTNFAWVCYPIIVASREPEITRRFCTCYLATEFTGRNSGQDNVFVRNPPVQPVLMLSLTYQIQLDAILKNQVLLFAVLSINMLGGTHLLAFKAPQDSCF